MTTDRLFGLTFDPMTGHYHLTERGVCIPANREFATEFTHLSDAEHAAAKLERLYNGGDHDD